MPLSQFDPHAALVVIDLQKGIVSGPMPTVHPVADIVANAAKLARAFRERQLPVVLVNVTAAPAGRTDAGPRNLQGLPSDWSQLVPELDVQPTDLQLSKQSPGAFAKPALDEFLRHHSVTQVFLVGISTSVGVESTARGAYDWGYNVIFVSDAITDRDAANHRHSFEKIFPRLGQIDTTETVLKKLNLLGT
jgi:nicotinamidase-related amidase